MRWWSGEAARFHTRLSPDQCRERLEAHVAPWWNPFAGRAFTGTPDPDRLTITPRHIAMHNSWQTWFVGRITASAEGAVISGHFRVARPTTVFMIFWLGAVGFMAITIAARGFATASSCWASLIPFGMFVFGLALPRLGGWLARNDRPEIVALFEGQLMAIAEAEPLR